MTTELEIDGNLSNVKNADNRLAKDSMQIRCKVLFPMLLSFSLSLASRVYRVICNMVKSKINDSAHSTKHNHMISSHNLSLCRYLRTKSNKKKTQYSISTTILYHRRKGFIDLFALKPYGT